MTTQNPNRDQVENCNYCGRTHEVKRCPAFNKNCNGCGVRGHFESVCQKKKHVNLMYYDNVDGQYDDYEDFDEDDMHFNDLSIHTLGVSDPSELWSVELIASGKAIKFQIDTGAQCNVLNEDSFRQIQGAKLDPSNSRIAVFGGEILRPIGRTTIPVSLKGQIYTLECEVIRNKKVHCILSDKDSIRLGLVKRVFAAEMEDEIEETLSKLDIAESTKNIVRKYKQVFQGVGKIPGQFALRIDPAVPPVALPSRPIPAALREQTKEQLDYLEKNDIIAKVPKGTHTPWVSQLHVVHKKDKKAVRICIDPKFLNKALLREYHPMSTVQDVLTRLDGCKQFTVLDANMGYYQIELAPESALLTTFNSPWGRYYYRRLPMGVKSAPEIFQRAMEEVFVNVPETEIIMDDLLLPTIDTKETDRVLEATLQTAEENNLRFRFSKSKFARREAEYVGSYFTDQGVKVSTEKVRAIKDMPMPNKVEDVRTLLGMATYLSKHIPQFSNVTAPLRDCIKTKGKGKNEPFFFDEPQILAFEELKQLLSNAPVLRYYSMNEPITVSCDASMLGLGAVILQGDRPVAYASKALTTTEQAYAQIEKELLAIVFACSKFHQMIYNRQDVIVETDHLPLVRIIEKPISQIPMRLQKMLLQLQKYTFKLVGKSGKEVPIADCLSRAPVETSYIDELQDFHVSAVEIISLAAFSEEKTEQLKVETRNDPIYRQLKQVIIQGWPDTRAELVSDVKPFWDMRDELAVYDDIVFRGERVMIPAAMQSDTLKLLHYSHQGIVKTKNLARDILCWKGMGSQIEDMIGNCALCQQNRHNQQKEPMIKGKIPELPWSLVSSDLFDYEGEKFMVTIDHYSGYIELDELKPVATAPVVISKLKRIMATHGIPDEFHSDNGPPYDANEFKKFAKEYGFTHITSSPTYAQSNGMAEKGVQIAKGLVKKSRRDKTDIELVLLDYRNTPRDAILGSPAQRAMGRRTRARLPITTSLLRPCIIEPSTIVDRLKELRSDSKEYYDLRSKELSKLQVGDTVRYKVKKQWVPAELVGEAARPRSYNIRTPAGNIVSRNRKDVLRTKEKDIYVPARRIERERQEDVGLDLASRPRQVTKSAPRPSQTDKQDKPVQAPIEPVRVPPVIAPPVSVTRSSGRAVRMPPKFKEFDMNFLSKCVLIRCSECARSSILKGQQD
jgi:hypothetical protein